MCQPVISFQTFIRVKYVPLKLIPEMPDSSGYRPCCSIAQRTNSIAFDLALNIPQQINVTHLALAIFYVLKNLFHPASAFAARGTLATAFMTIKPCEG